MTRWLALLVVVAGCGRKGGDNPAADIERMCNAPALSASEGIADPAERAAHASAWLAKNVVTPEGKLALDGLAGAFTTDDRRRVLKDLAAKYGYTGPCPAADEPGRVELRMQNEREDMERICNAESLAGVYEDDPARATKLAAWIAKNVTSPSVMKAMGELAAADAADRGERLRAIAKQHGFAGPCPMADNE